MDLQRIACSELRLKRIIDGMKVTRIRHLTSDVLLRWRSSRLEEGVANRTVNMEVASLKALLNWAVRNRLALVNPLQHLQTLPSGEAHRRFRRRALSDREIDAFLVAAAEDDRREALRTLAQRTIDNGTKGQRYEQKPRQPRIPQLPL